MSMEFDARKIEILERQLEELNQTLYYFLVKAGGKIEISDELIISSTPPKDIHIEVEHDVRKGNKIYKIIERRKKVDKEKDITKE